MEYNKSLVQSLESINKKFNELNKEIEMITDDISKLKEINRQLKHTAPIIEKYKDYKKIIDSAIDAENILNNESDQELIELAKLELEEAKQKIPNLEDELKILLLPRDPNDDRNVIVEMRPAAGGDEASIFVADLFDTYKRYSESQGWKLKILDMSMNAYGYDYIFFSISGDSVYSKMKYESGVHRVQRVPATESKGRVHTSTITVAVLPELDEIDVKVNPSDLRIDTYRASGAGGQHVNRTESAVRITHIPTGIVASCQEGKSQIENRETCMKMLYAKLWEKYQSERNNEVSSMRKNQVGTGERSEKIRTYNYPQNRVTDHRIGLTLNKLEIIMQGELDEIINGLIVDEQTKLMNELKI